MSKIEILLLDSSNTSKGKINMIKPNTLKELFNQLRQNFKNVVGFYEIFYIGKNKKVTKIYTNEDYKIVDDILFVREVESKCFKQSSSGINKNKNVNLLKDKNIENYKIFIEKTIKVFKNIIDQIKSIHNILNLNNNIKLCSLAKNNPLSFENLEIDEISNAIEEELEQIKNQILNINKMNIFHSIIKNNQMLNQINNNYNTKSNNFVINNSKTIMQYNLVNMNQTNNSNKDNDIMNDKFSMYKSEIKLKYFTNSEGNYNIFGKEFVEKNIFNIDLIVNGKKQFLVNNIELLKGENTIKMIIKNQLSDLSNMFLWCNCLKDIKGLKDLDVKEVKDFSNMFSGCSLITDLTPLQNWNVSNGINFSNMFCNCWKLEDLTPLKNWDVSKGMNFQRMFYGCSSLSDVTPIKNWNVSINSDFSNIFQECTKLFSKIKKRAFASVEEEE